MNQDEYGHMVRQHLGVNDPRAVVVETLGSIEFLLEGIRQNYLITRAECLAHSFNKMTHKEPDHNE